MDKTLKEVKEFLAPFSNRVYIVGGFVRDNLIKHSTNNDIDLEVFEIEIEIFQKLMDELGAVGVGKSFFVYKYKEIDIALPRTEKKISFGHTGFRVSLEKDEKIASQRRDFTINGLMYNIYTDEILDFWNGIEDIKSKKIKIIDKNSFIEDSLRVLRGIRFSSKLGFKIESNSLKIMKDIDLNDLSKERISKEFEGIFRGKYLEYSFYYLYKLNILKKLFDIYISKSDFRKIYRELKYRKSFFQSYNQEYYFLFILNSFIDIKLINWNLPNRYKIILKQEKLYKKIDLKKLLIISLDTPIKNWLGALDKNIIDLAKKYDIYEAVLDTKIEVKEIIDNGFKREAIKVEIKKQQLKFINDIINYK